MQAMRELYRLQVLFAGLILACSANAGITAKSYIVLDGSTVLAQKNPDEIRSIASITKLFTVRAAEAYDLDELLEVSTEDIIAGRMRSTPLRAGRSYSRRELIDLALVSSDNVAAIVLGRSSFAPNLQSSPSTSIVESSGLNPSNVSTARDLATVAQALIGTDLARSSIQPSVSAAGSVRNSTNPLLRDSRWTFEVSKTGFINESGGCLVAVFRAGGRTLTAVILGSRDVRSRWSDLIQLRQEVLKEPVTKPRSVTKR